LIGITLRNTLSGLSLKDATLGMLASLAVKGSIPGPMDTAFRFRLAVAYDYSVEESSLSAAMLKALDWIARLLMIPIAIGILLASGQGIEGLEWLAVIGLIISIVGIALLVGIVRSQRLARWVGERLQQGVEWLMKRLDRQPPGGLAERVMGLRDMGQELMNTTGLLGLGLQIVVQAAWASVLTLAMSFVGVDFEVLPVSIVWASVALVYMLPIGPGFIEIAYVLIYGLAIGFDDPVLGVAVAGVMIFRLFQWLIPIPIGYGLIFYWQKRDNFNLLSAESAQVQADDAIEVETS
ncbi:MAG: lysylphosphatidylglycerol synthase domain-containing protein, partial [Chloroflexota bacterium]